MKGDYDRAIADASKAIRLEPRYAPSYVTRGEAYRMKGEYDRAIADASEAIRLEPKSPFAYRVKGTACRQKGDFSSAITDLTEALRLDPAWEWAKSELEMAKRKEARAAQPKRRKGRPKP
jgi:tetratricopeptide (TPR) repeat protein